MTKYPGERCFLTLLPFAAEQLRCRLRSRNNYLWSSITVCILHTPPFFTVAKTLAKIVCIMQPGQPSSGSVPCSRDSINLITCTKSEFKNCRLGGTYKAETLFRTISKTCLQSVPSLILHLKKHLCFSGTLQCRMPRFLQGAIEHPCKNTSYVATKM